jgi:hypothetical protein
MHAEVFVRFREEIRLERLIAGLPPGSDPAVVLVSTTLRANPHVLPVILYARTEAAFTYLVSWADARSLSLHVESRGDKPPFRDLVRRAERLADAFIDLGASHGAVLHHATITLYTGEVPILEGTHQRFGERLMKRFAETIFGDVVVGIFTGLLTGVVAGQWNAALVAGLAPVLCLLAWIVIQIRGERDAYEYVQR